MWGSSFASGSVIRAWSKKILAPLGAIEAEANAIELALQFAKDLLMQDFILESDSMTLVNALKESLPRFLIEDSFVWIEEISCFIE